MLKQLFCNPAYIQQKLLNCHFRTLKLKLATKHKLFPVGYDSGSILGKKNEKKFSTILSI